MAAKAPERITQDFQDALERARQWEETDPQRARQLEREAYDQQSRDLQAYAAEQAEQGRTATLNGLRTTLAAKYPKADPNAIVGSTPDELEASAKRSHEFVEAQVKAAEEAARATRRATTREQWTGATTGTRVGMPGGETITGTPISQQEAEGAYNRTAEVIAQSRLPGHLRRYSPDNTQAVPPAGDPEMAAWSDYKKLHANSGLTFEAFRARNEGKATLVETNAGVPADEDRKG